MYQRKSEFLYQLEMEKAFLIKTKTFKAIKEKTKNLTSKICKAKKEQFKRRIRDLEREGKEDLLATIVSLSPSQFDLKWL